MADELAFRNEGYGHVVRPGDVLIGEGDVVYCASAQSFQPDNPFRDMPRMHRAVIVARLRCLADIIEGGGQP